MGKIGIMGGTFNPIHKGHISVAKAAMDQFSLDEIWWLPSHHPPHKQNDKIASNQERLDMIQLAIEPYPFFSINTIEMDREGYSYTADTLLKLKKSHPNYDFHFIMGADSLHYMEHWKDPSIIFQQARILSAPRYPSTKQKDMEQKIHLEKIFNGNISFIQMEPIEISSTELINKIKDRKEVSEFLPAKVLDYIKQQDLYDINKHAKHTLHKIRDFLQSELPKKRYVHTLGVQHTAACLAMRYHVDFYKASIAGLLHDCAKSMDDKVILKQCIKYGLPVSDTEERNPFLLHGKLGAHYGKIKFEIEDEEILNAVIYHTTGRPNMTFLEKIIFIADYIEPERKILPKMGQIRETAFNDLDKAVLLILENTLNHLNDKHDKKDIDETTIAAYYFYKNKQKGE